MIERDLQKGFIALTSAIIISILLLAITVSLGFSGFFTRFNILDSESKERSAALAEACGDGAILEVSQGTYPTGESVTVGPASLDKCTIISATQNGTQTIIKTQACPNKSVTNLTITIDNSSFAITNWQELANFSPNIPCS